MRLKNQFRHLDEDEIEFLDSVLESTRKQEAEVKRETSQKLDLFRKQQDEADRSLLDKKPESKGEETFSGRQDEWALNRTKRKRNKEKQEDSSQISKLRRTPSYFTGGGSRITDRSHPLMDDKARKPSGESQSKTATSDVPQHIADKAKSKAGLGLEGYRSDESD